MADDDDTPGFSTLAIHAGAQPDPATGARITPIYQTTAFVFEDVEHAADLFALRTFGNIYTRIMNPTRRCWRRASPHSKAARRRWRWLRAMRRSWSPFMPCMRPGDEFVAARQLYGGSINQFNHSFNSFGWHVAWADAEDPGSIAKAMTDKTKAIFIESIANPGGRITDIAAIAKIAARRSVPLIVDNTLATPYLCKPFEHGANIVVHSLTKFMGGHGNSMGGAIVDGGNFDWSKERQIPAPLGAECLLSRHALPRDLRQHRLCHRLPRARACAISVRPFRRKMPF